MSKAEELAEDLEKHWNTQAPLAVAAELRRLAALEEELNALKSALMDAEPVAQIRMSDGGLSVVNRVTTKGVQVSVHRTDGDWTPLYTLNGIKP